MAVTVPSSVRVGLALTCICLRTLSFPRYISLWNPSPARARFLMGRIQTEHLRRGSPPQWGRGAGPVGAYLADTSGTGDGGLVEPRWMLVPMRPDRMEPGTDGGDDVGLGDATQCFA